jgi:hypothetical protein
MASLRRKLENVLERVGGLVGGLVCGFVACVAAFYFYGVYHFSFWTFVPVCCGVVPLFSLLGVLFPRPFLCFAMPALIFLGGGDPGGPSELPMRLELQRFALTAAFVFGMAALVFGSLFQVHVVFAAAAAVLLIYAVFAPGVFSHDE